MNFLDRYDTEYLNSLYRNLWWESSTKVNIPISKISYIEQKENEKKLDEFVKELIDHIEKFPENISHRLKWKKVGVNLIENALLNQEIFKFGLLNEEMKDQFFDITRNFIKTSRAFDEKIPLEDIGQALRNVWIVNIFQKILGEDIKLTNSVFGYSMLYPYTDNYLDNTKIPIYDKLLLIHQAQIKSLTQQGGISIPYEKDILGISIEKGGASVLADGYLIRGSLAKDEEVFAYGYGFFLQLCDDLQDVKTDIENNHMTIMSQLASNYNLDLIASKLINLTLHVIDNAKCFNCSMENELRNLIKCNCINMIMIAIANSKEFFTKEYIKDIEEFLPFTLKYTVNIKKKSLKQFKHLKPSYNSIPIDEILMYLLE